MCVIHKAKKLKLLPGLQKILCDFPVLIITEINIIFCSGEFEVLKNARPESVKVAMSPSGNSFAISASRHIRLYSTLQPQKEFKMSMFLYIMLHWKYSCFFNVYILEDILLNDLKT